MNIETAHAHIATASRDCDGPFYRDYTVFVDDEAKAKSAACDGVNDFWDIEFRESILTSQVSLTTLTDGRKAEIVIREEGFHYSEETDEGYRSADVRWCDDEFCGESYSQRDIYAEMMNY